jgi:hypothetical protein
MDWRTENDQQPPERTPPTSYQDDAIDCAVDELGLAMIEFQNRMDNDPAIREMIQKHIF